MKLTGRGVHNQLAAQQRYRHRAKLNDRYTQKLPDAVQAPQAATATSRKRRRTNAMAGGIWATMIRWMRKSR